MESTDSSPVPQGAALSLQLVEFSAYLFSVALYGITCLQTYVYFVHHHQRDRWFLKLFVVYLWVMDSVHLYFDALAEWLLIRHPGLPDMISKEIIWGGLFTGLVALPVQIYFVLRIWKLVNLNRSKGWRYISLGIIIILVLCSLFQFVAYVVFLYLILRGRQDAQGIILIAKLPTAFWAAGAAEDVVISLTLLWLLWRDRIVDSLAGLRGADNAPVQTVSNSTERLMRRVSIVVVNTGLWTAVCALAMVIALQINPTFQLYPGLFFCLGPLYCNTLLANLNGRGFIRGEEYTTVYDTTRTRRSFLSNPFKTRSTGDLSSRATKVGAGNIIPLGDMSTTYFETPTNSVKRKESGVHIKTQTFADSDV
ncbi:hypothetical protein C8Q76DRAFT_58819 [Earliella scabrosa]|nr:hypothetical protein C8Q76DRAFT_58819 [Earliella scabrosa]